MTTAYKNFRDFMLGKVAEARKVCPTVADDYESLAVVADNQYEAAKAKAAGVDIDVMHINELQNQYGALKYRCTAAARGTSPVVPDNSELEQQHGYVYEPETPTPTPVPTTPPSVVVPTGAPKMSGVGWLAIIGGLIAGYYFYKNR
jgi:hypothetical protein